MMRDSDKTTLLVMIAVIAGFIVGWIACTHTASHKLLLEEYKKAKGINLLIDTKLEQAITDYKKGPKDARKDGM